MTTSDKRASREQPIARIEVPQQSWISANTDVLTQAIPTFSGTIEQIEVIISNATNAITFTVAIATANVGSVYSQAAIPENASTVYKATSDASSFDAILVAGALTLTFTPSGDPGASGVTVDVYLYVK